MAYLLTQPRMAEYPPYVFFGDVFTPDECERIVDMQKGRPMTSGVTGVAGQLSERRRARIGWVDWDGGTDWVYQRLSSICDTVRSRWYPFHLAGFVEPLQLTHYRHGDASHYGMHRDMGPGVMSTRKLSLVTLLTPPQDYDGGELRLAALDEAIAESKQGNVVAFPSWEMHSVSPITRGERWSLVAWVHGPPFA